MDDTYLTLAGDSEGIYREKGSKFLAFAYRVKDEDEIKEKLAHLKRKHHDARHHCFAYILGAKKEEFRAFDDGEPPHTAGSPILGQIRSNDLTNVLIVVVRYFGGTKLGKSGLIAAYKTAAADAISANSIISEAQMLPMALRFEFRDMGEVMRMIQDDGIKLVQQHFENSCLIKLEVREGIIEELKNRLSQIPSVSIED